MTGLDISPEKENDPALQLSRGQQKMFCWGNTSNGELGLGGIEEQHILAPRENNFSVANNDIRTIACGASHTLVVLNNGEVYSCGNNDYGQLGHEKSRTKLQLVDGLKAYKIVAAACGESHSLVLDQWGQLFSWGSDLHGQLGQNTGEQFIIKPKLVKGLVTSTIVQIACGSKHCLALSNKGELFSWGYNENGQLGLGLKNRIITVPTLVSSLVGLPISLVACGSSHSFILSKSGAVYGWGKNRFGQLGLNSEIDHIYPSQLKTLRSIKVKFVDCGEDFSVFLTQDGGVLTCGAGMYGQLGHGSSSNEVLPRKVIELMGSTVTQVSCGRRHTLVFMPSRERVYAFGLGSAGQLGTKQLMNSNGPLVVQGPWLDHKAHIEALYSGGDQSFATVTSKRRSADYRLMRQDAYIWTITIEKMMECQQIPEETPVEQELLTYLETVFSAPACINGSFLLSRDQHYCCTSRHHGLDLGLAQSCFTAISRANNPTVREVCLEAVAHIIPQLVESPPDVETLRIYLTLPLYHEFNNARHASKIQGPFAVALLRLKNEAAKIVDNWYKSAPEEYLERLIRIYKSVAILLLKASPYMSMDYQWDLNLCESTVINSLDLLANLSKINNLRSDEKKLNYEIFHLPELSDVVDIRIDYVRWSTEDPKSRSARKYFCHYPFLFDAEAKTLLLQTDQSIQMHNAVSQAAQQALTQILFSPIGFPVQALLELQVSRNNIVQDTIRELSNYSEKDYKKPLKIHFLGEEAEDAGGVKKEFFLLLLKEVLDPKYGMFKSDPETRAIWFSEDSFEDEIMYYLVGLLCGLAIYNFIIINLPFPLVLYKKLLGEPVGFQDLKDFSPTLASSFQGLLEYDGDEFESLFPLKFEVTREVYGAMITEPLKQNGSNIPLTKENRQEYIDLYVNYILNTSVQRHFIAFHDAFHKVCGGRVLQLFHAQELMAVVIGNENYDWEALENGAEYRGGYSRAEKTIQQFWEVFHELPLEEKKKFLLFLTGSDRIPIQGMKAIKIIIQPTLDDRYLPVAHTCFNILDLPRYSTKERLRYKLCQAIQQTQGFSIV